MLEELLKFGAPGDDDGAAAARGRRRAHRDPAVRAPPSPAAALPVPAAAPPAPPAPFAPTVLNNSFIFSFPILFFH